MSTALVKAKYQGHIFQTFFSRFNTVSDSPMFNNLNEGEGFGTGPTVLISSFVGPCRNYLVSAEDKIV